MNKFRAFTIMLSLFIIIGISYSNFSVLNVEDYVITPNSFYRGESEENPMNAKEYYNALNGLSYSENDNNNCKPDVVLYPNAFMLPSNYAAFCSSITDTSAPNGDWATFLGEDASGVFKDGDKIIAPIGSNVDNTSFKNNNQLLSSLDNNATKTNIEFIIDENTLLVFEDVKCWWCHAHNPSYNAHNVIVGHVSSGTSSEQETVYIGSQIGIANSTTKAKVYVIPQQNRKVGYSILDVKSYSELQQINTGNWFQDLTEVPVSSNNQNNTTTINP